MEICPPGQDVQPTAVVADDDATQRLLLRASLEKAGFLVEEARNGAGAITLVQKHVPDLVVLDVMMPSVDGFTACRELRQLTITQHTPIVMVTAADDIESIEQAYDAGATDFIAKPINWTIFVQRMRYMARASQALAELRTSREHLADAQEIANLGSWEFEPSGSRFDCSAELYRILGHRKTDRPFTISNFLEYVHIEDRSHLRAALEDGVRAKRGFSFEFRVVRRDKTERTLSSHAKIVDRGGSVALRGTCLDVTELREAEARMFHLAHHDALTDLPNRVLFHDRLGQSIARADRDNVSVAVLCIDLDHFKDVNDTLGHAAGDKLLQATSRRLQEEIRASDTLARLGGDEFAIVEVGSPDQDGVNSLATRIVERLTRPFNIDGHEVLVGASVGIAMCPKHGHEAEQLLKNADIALYKAKASGRQTYCHFHEGMDDHLRARKAMEQDLRQALLKNWFLLYYQPQLDVKTGKVIGAEALLRLEHPEKGLLNPGEFIPLAEDIGLINPIGEWVLRAAASRGAKWHKQGLRLRIAVNISPSQFQQTDLPQIVGEILRETDFDPRYLELEITESVLMSDTAASLKTLHALRELGVHVAMDDFGTGYSSLSYLRLFPFDRIKIDRSFISGLTESPDSAAIVRAIVLLGRSLKMLTTAEGVETATQLAMLADESCDEVQGFHLSVPLPAEQLEQWMLPCTPELDSQAS